MACKHETRRIIKLDKSGDRCKPKKGGERSRDLPTTDLSKLDKNNVDFNRERTNKRNVPNDADFNEARMPEFGQ